MDEVLRDFYGTFAQVSFTILGLWMVVVQGRLKEWSASPARRLGARTVAIHFTLPAIMSLLSLTSPDSRILWRVAFGGVALVGAVGVSLVTEHRPAAGADRWGRLELWAATALYGAIAFVALLAGPVATLVPASALQVEAILVSLMMFLGLNMAFRLLFSSAEEQSA